MQTHRAALEHTREAIKARAQAHTALLGVEDVDDLADQHRVHLALQRARLADQRIHAAIALQQPLLRTVTATEEYTILVVAPPLEVLESEYARKDMRRGGNDLAHLGWLTLDPYAVAELARLRAANQYMALRRVRITFRGNSTTQRALILAYYVGPEDADADRRIATQPASATLGTMRRACLCAESYDGSEGVLQLESPPLVQGVRIGTTTHTLPGLCEGLVLCTPGPETRANAGTVFVATTALAPEPVAVRVAYTIDFYTTTAREYGI